MCRVAKGSSEVTEQPFGVEVRKVKCLKCGALGHVNTDSIVSCGWTLNCKHYYSQGACLCALVSSTSFLRSVLCMGKASNWTSPVSDQLVSCRMPLGLQYTVCVLPIDLMNVIMKNTE